MLEVTEENYRYRTSPFLLRNQFKGKGKFKIPIIPKFQEKEDDFTDLKLIGFDKTKLENNNHLDRMVHFSCMTINLSVCGKIQMLTLKS